MRDTIFFGGPSDTHLIFGKQTKHLHIPMTAIVPYTIHLIYIFKFHVFSSVLTHLDLDI